MKFLADNISNLPAPVQTDIAEVSLAILPRPRPDPTEKGFFRKVDDPTPFEISVATLSRTLARQVKDGAVSQDEADKKLADYRSRPFELPKGTVVMMSAGSPPPKTARLSDPRKEAAIAGSIASGLFKKIPERCLVPVGAFTDTRWRLVYIAGCEIRKRTDSGNVCCVEAVNDFIAFNGLDEEMQEAVDSTKTFPWQRWVEFADMSMADEFSTTLPLEYCLGELDYLYRKRSALAIYERIASGAIELKQAQRELVELVNGANGANFSLEAVDERRFDAARLHDKPEPTILLDGKPIAPPATSA